jgi:1,5-anhydro-D-fructose reductase (1,5-anhydro-D-mannitol-forming)
VRTRLNWAIVGCGAISDVRIAPALTKSKTSQLVAVVGRDVARTEAFAAKHGAAKFHTSLDGLLGDPAIDVVYIGTPNAQHCQQAIAALQAGHHVLCEKPMALTVPDCREMIKASERNGRRLSVGFNNRFNPAHRELRRRLLAGEIGQPLFTVVRFAVQGSRQRWRLHPNESGGGALMDMGVHAVDLVRYLLNAEVAHVSAFAAMSPSSEPLDDAVTALLRLDGSVAYAVIHVSALETYIRTGVDVNGSDGFVGAVDTLVRQVRFPVPASGTLFSRSSKGVEEISYPADDMFLREVDSFARAVQAGHEPNVSGTDGLRAQEVVRAIQEAYETGRTVQVRKD